MENLGIVILNYLNYEDTVECIDSIVKQTVLNIPVVIVDNCSNNNSLFEISKHIAKLPNINLISSKKNLGYAKGNNLGIKFLRNRYKIKNILICNNDVLFSQVDYLEKILEIKLTKNMGVIGTKIIGSDNQNQNPMVSPSDYRRWIYFKIRTIFDSKIVNKQLFNKIKEALRSKRSTSSIEINSIRKLKPKEVLQGAVIILTENYFENFSGLYPETFLYYEENILKSINSKLGLTLYYYDDLEIYHKEDCSSAMSFNNDSLVMKKFVDESEKIAVKVMKMDIKKIYSTYDQYYKKNFDELDYDEVR